MAFSHIHQIVLNNDANTSTYILDMAVACDTSAFAVASSGSANVISVYDPHSGRCIHPALTGHEDVINSVSYSISSPSHILSASDDQTVRLFDCRTSTQPVTRISLDAEVYTAALGMHDNLIAIGSGNSVSFYDSRNTATPLGCYADCHSDNIMKLKFHPLQGNILHSAGEDGLICAYDTAVAAEEDAVLSICNTECPVRQIGFFGNGLEGVFSLSTVETASCWHFPSSQRIGEFSTIREDFGVDYLVDCWGSDSDPNGLFMAIGSHDGEMKVCSVDPSGLIPQYVLPASSATNPNGHSDTIRACKKIHSAANGCDILLSAGEDGKICMWRQGTVPPVPAVTSVAAQFHDREKNINRLDDTADDALDFKKRRRI